LPKYRGASPIQSIFLNDEKETWITIMKMDASMDTWNMIEKLKFKIPFDRTCKDVIEKMKEVWPKFLNDVLWKYSKQMLGEEEQNNDDTSYCSKIEKESWLIDPEKDSLEEIYNKYRGFFVWPKIYFVWKDKRVIIESLKLDEKIFEENKKNPLIEWKDLNKAIIEIRVKPEGKKVMERNSFVNGYLK
jgi:methionyl-tRNA formyltransferase